MLFKYSGKYVNIYFNMKIAFVEFLVFDYDSFPYLLSLFSGWGLLFL